MQSAKGERVLCGKTPWAGSNVLSGNANSLMWHLGFFCTCISLPICLFWLFLCAVLLICSMALKYLNQKECNRVKVCACSRSSYLFCSCVSFLFNGGVVENVETRLHFCFQKGEMKACIMKASLGSPTSITISDERHCNCILNRKNSIFFLGQF